ncbi:hypothetical protein [Actinoplanes sp. NBRC 101535]|uniref:hypothetical protein n=1 Tax=Actinoplanes sp. NBRC 101535 TaxID=3032196 RepID=UPI0024A25FE3|nr:hypothetical protein [Actinoplanes sp. NBRC 101535]GLY07381.1 hypothetical protein Acsp01_77600 [Actinoplanes sp. NBRC 101535]
MSSDSLVLAPADIHPESAALAAALARQDWPACRAVLTQPSPGARSWLIATGAERTGGGEFLAGVLVADPDDHTAAVMLAAHQVWRAWEARSAATAEHVTEQGYAMFHRWLVKAERLLVETAARAPGDATVWTQRLITARGLQLGLPEVRRRYARLAAVAPHHLPGQYQLLQSLCPKWGGTWEQAYAFAREATAAAPAGSPTGMLIPMVHLERWLDLKDARGDAAGDYLRGAEVREELTAAADRSVWHPDFAREPGWVRTLSTFAMAFSLAGDRPAAARAFTELGSFASAMPWEYAVGPVTATIRRHRSRALAHAAATR